MNATLLYACLQILSALQALPGPVGLAALESTASHERRPDDAGRAFRVESPEGPVRIWLPPHYDPATAATVVYVHGYNRSADVVWSVSALPRQFLASGRNAVFVVPTVAENDRAPLRWGRLSALLSRVERAGVPLPGGPVVAVGHSGAYRTLSRWVDEPRLDAVVLLDALYGQEEAFARFARHGRLVLVGHCTAARTERFLRRFAHVPRRDELPGRSPFTAEERSAPVVYFGTHLGHAALNDDGAAIPSLLSLALPGHGPEASPDARWLEGTLAQADWQAD